MGRPTYQDVTVTFYDDLGHLPGLEAPKRMIADYTKFLADHGVRASA